MCNQTERSSKSKCKLAEISFRKKSPAGVKMFPDSEQIKQIFHCGFSNNMRSSPSILNSSETLPSLRMFRKCWNAKERTMKTENLQNSSDGRLGRMGQNREPVHFRRHCFHWEEIAEQKNGHKCKITSLDFSALHTPTSNTTLKKKNQNHEANPKHSCTPWCSLTDRFWTALQTIFKGPAKISQQKKGTCKQKRLKRCCSLITTGTDRC